MLSNVKTYSLSVRLLSEQATQWETRAAQCEDAGDIFLASAYKRDAVELRRAAEALRVAGL